MCLWKLDDEEKDREPRELTYRKGKKRPSEEIGRCTHKDGSETGTSERTKTEEGFDANC